MDRRATFKSTWLAFALIAPQLILVFIFFYWPAAQSLFWALTLEAPFGGATQFVGLQNFETVFSDKLYWNSVRVSILFALSSTTLTMVMALLLASFVDRQLAGYRVYRFVYFWPYAIAAPAVGLAFRFIFAPDAGFVSSINKVFPNLWNPALDGLDAFILIVIANSWKMIAYSFIFFLAGLQAIPRTITEAAAMDGAGVLRRLWDLQLPLLAPTFFFLLVINITESFVDSFGIVDIITGGGPARATDLMVFKIYSDGFKGLDYSMAAAQSIVLMVLVVSLTFVQFRYVEKRVHYA
ncbi:MAG: ABC transporter permease subunit [Methylocystis sp.]|nr:ABC transporter permease subunit [Methylocystis sp.]MCA3585088.1 ABC transporter permease subunit [Methylocystis sp.]MCA3589044.1 ABC transporter permease subunit [Methylocystis sp.]MCA3592306.1 ABC transporter permease subunit [Methylocystis sp.]